MPSQRGFSLLQVLVALAITGIVAAILLSALSTGARATLIADQRATAESLARAQMEYIQRQVFSDTPWDYTIDSSQRESSQPPSWWDDDNPPLLSSGHTGYAVSASAADFDADGDTHIEVPGDDDGIRIITVEVYRPGAKIEPLITLQDYKVNH